MTEHREEDGLSGHVFVGCGKGKDRKFHLKSAEIALFSNYRTDLGEKYSRLKFFQGPPKKEDKGGFPFKVLLTLRTHLASGIGFPMMKQERVTLAPGCEKTTD